MVTTDPGLPGPTETNLNAALRRYAVGVRVLVVLAGVVLALLGAPPDPLPTVLVTVVASGWCALSAWWMWGARTCPHPALVTGAAVVVLLVVELTQPWTAVGPYNGWAFSVASITCIGMQLEQATKPRLGVLVAVVAAVSYTVGAAMTRQAWDAGVFGARLLLETSLARGGYVLLRSRARAADETRARASAQRRATEVAAARRAAEREYLATLHDTASSTLLMVSLGAASGGHRAWLPDRARRDLDAITTSPALPETLPGTGGSGSGGSGTGTAAGAEPATDTGAGLVNLATLLDQAAEHPLVTVKRNLPQALPVPARPALAISHGVREAVENVARHAGVTEATLTGHVDDTHPAPRIEVTLADDGAGFDPAAAREHRRGVADSIVGRMAAVGGHAEIDSAPGAGTTVRWSWHG
ncbi:sensor histidine kinase [Prauserella rugosa]|uniref:Signal transduction histidine kinase n=1 Tax=Prauserella rugosa TaxID=43354 RepID=A0A660C4Q2_9PSEU|nr:ATP-binding protein [Prauserella rugosa]TWH18518.1 signal transduction histidine kinase [Prauserella rugosa]